MGLRDIRSDAEWAVKLGGEENSGGSAWFQAQTTKFVAVVVLFLLLPIWLLSLGATIGFLRFMTQPALYGYVPVWMVVVGAIMLVVWYFRSRSPY